MAKIDFCFTFYDGDAAKDVAHMNRLERGAYYDLISAQRKRGHLSKDDIKKVLGGDFEICWNAIEWILEKDAEGRYYIEWLENSLEKMRRHSKKQIVNIAQRWNNDNADIVPKEYQKNTKHIPSLQDGITSNIPLENGNENEYGDENEEGNEIFGKSENLLPEVEENSGIVVQMLQLYQRRFPRYPPDKSKDNPALLQIAYKIADGLPLPRSHVVDNDPGEHIKRRWGEILDFAKADAWFSTRSISDLNNEWQRLNNKIHSNDIISNRTGKNGKIVLETNPNADFGQL